MRVPQRDRSNLVILGTSRYDDDDLHDLPGVRNNVRDLWTLLTDPTHGIVADDRCTVMLDQAGPRAALQAVREHAKAATDTLVVYFAGHGLLSDDRLHLAMRDTSTADVAVSGLAFEQLHEAVYRNGAGNKIVILDCCFSGRAINGSVDGDSYLITSTPSNRQAVAPLGLTHTAFSGELIRLLRDGIRDGPKTLSVHFLFERLRSAMQAGGFPAPANRMTGTASGVVLSRNRWSPSAGVPTPAAVREATAVPGAAVDPRPSAGARPVAGSAARPGTAGPAGPRFTTGRAADLAGPQRAAPRPAVPSAAKPRLARAENAGPIGVTPVAAPRRSDRAATATTPAVKPAAGTSAPATAGSRRSAAGAPANGTPAAGERVGDTPANARPFGAARPGTVGPAGGPAARKADGRPAAGSSPAGRAPVGTTGANVPRGSASNPAPSDVRAPAARYTPLPRPVFCPDGETLVVAGRHGRMEIWDVIARRLRHTVADGVAHYAIGVGGTTLATAGRDHTIGVWTIRDGRQTARLDTAGRWLALHPTAPLLLCIGREPGAEIWDVRTHRRVRTLRGHDGDILRGGFSQDGGRVLTTGLDRTLRVWDARTGRQLTVLTGVHSPRQAAFHTGAGWAATTLASGGVRLRSLDSGEKLADLRDESIPVEVLAGPDGRTLATLTADGRVRVFDIHSRRTLLDRRDDQVSRILYGPGPSLATLTNDGVVRLRDIRTGRVRHTLRDGPRAPCWLTFDQDGNRAALGRRDGTVHLFDLRAGGGPHPLRAAARPAGPPLGGGGDGRADDFLRSVYERLRTGS